MESGTAVINERETAPDEVLALLRDEAALYEQLEGFAQRQRSLVTHEDAAPLLALLTHRQRLAVELSEIGVRLSPVRRSWPEYRTRLSTPQRAEAERLIECVAERLQRLIAGDEHDARLLSARKTMMGREMRAAHATGRAIAAYRGPARPRRTARLDEAT